MTEKLIEQMITGAPNFVGFVFGLVLAYRVIVLQNRLISELMLKWEHCEDDAERINWQKQTNTN